MILYVPSEDTDEGREMHLKSYNIEIMIYDRVDEVIEKLYESLLNIYQIDVEAPVRGSNVIFDYVILLHYKCHKTNLKRGGSSIDSPDWIKK